MFASDWLRKKHNNRNNCYSSCTNFRAESVRLRMKAELKIERAYSLARRPEQNFEQCRVESFCWFAIIDVSRLQSIHSSCVHDVFKEKKAIAL